MTTPPTNAPIPFINLAAQQALIRDRLDAALTAILDHGQYIMGPEVGQLESALGAFSSNTHVISCSSGTDALMLALIALGLKPRQDTVGRDTVKQGVIVPSFTFAATAEVLPYLGAVPIFADIDPVTFNLDPNGLAAAAAAAEAAGIECVGIITVGLFGQAADYDGINAYAKAHDMWVLDDAAQSYGASWNGTSVGHLGEITATSFFPAKPLGCYGDGGAVFTENAEFAEVMRSTRVHGMGHARYAYDRIGMTARLDTIQAAVLLEKLKLFNDELTQRQQAADRYAEGLAGIVDVPKLAHGATSSWAQYTVKLPIRTDRNDVQVRLNADGIPSAIYYTKGMHEHPPYADFPVAIGGLPVTDDCCRRVLSLPIHAYLDGDTQNRIISSLIAAVK